MLTYIMEYKSKYEKYKTKYLELKKTIDVNQSGGSKPELYLFKADWCGHCKAFKDDWDALSKNPSLNKKINFITMDSNDNKDEIKEWKVVGFPTLILKNGSEAFEYGGNRTVDDVKSFIEKHIN